MTPYYAGLNEKLLAAIPPSRKVLELGCAEGRLGRRYKELNPAACWHGVDIHEPSVELARQHLDRVWLANVDSGDLSSMEDGYDCVVIGDLLEHLKEPEKLLEALRSITTSDAYLACCVPNGAHISIVERMLIGDLSYDANGLLDRRHLRQFSQSSLFKLFLDTGWLPQLVDQYRCQHPNTELAAALLACSRELRSSQDAAERALFCYQMIVVCKQASWTSGRSKASISVIVPVNNEAQFALNVARSPGLGEMNSETIACRHAQTAADAFETGRAQSSGEWLLFCHQDVYFPRNFGLSLSKVLSTIPKGCADHTVIGFAGIGGRSRLRPYTWTFNAGLVVDRTDLLDWPHADFAVSLDEFAVVLHRDTRLAIDPKLGWHLWATDLCLQAMTKGTTAGRVIRIPVYHNSLTGYVLPPEFSSSATTLANKYPDIGRIRSLCGQVTSPKLLQPC